MKRNDALSRELARTRSNQCLPQHRSVHMEIVVVVPSSALTPPDRCGECPLKFRVLASWSQWSSGPNVVASCACVAFLSLACTLVVKFSLNSHGQSLKRLSAALKQLEVNAFMCPSLQAEVVVQRSLLVHSALE